MQDITVRLKYSLNGATCVEEMTFTSLQPTSVNGPVYTDSAKDNGYQTVAMYIVRDQFCYSMHNFPAGESFDNDRADDWLGNNWPTVVAGGADFPGPQIYDVMAAYGIDGIPTPENPHGGDDRIYHHTQHLWVGSTGGTGCRIKSHTQQFYRDHARHE